ncbi:myosin-2 heavy chain-like [Varroa jacobsoni]|uniref:Uncharacterized protein n=1 Tax=Varroa destructor TaxID=109461 RepID=A0A7M7JCH7_VARDE|nr:myosin-2 heavy chain-like isoform X1 [Varroa destructor]XP_022692103.1 myosin-2 heavy chain-like [Varroa jacobsoni]
MTTPIRLENEQLGSAHFDAIREQDEARALEDVRQKERELEQEAVHAFDDLLEHSQSSDTSSYYKPPTSQFEVNHREELYNQCQKELEDSRKENIRLVTELSILRREFAQLAKDKSTLEDELQKVQTRVSLLEQENGELSDSQNVHRVKDQYEAVIEKLNASHKREKTDIIQQLNKYKEEAQLARNHICVSQEIREEKCKLEQELRTLRTTVDSLHQKELELQLKVTEQSILLREKEHSASLWDSGNDAIMKICQLANISPAVDIVGKSEDKYILLLDACCDRFRAFRDGLSQKTLELEQAKRKCDELRVCIGALEKENHVLKEKLEHNNSDTESQSETAKLGHLKAAQVARVAAEQLESHNLQLKLQVQTLEEQKSKLQLELKNLINVDAKHKAEIAELMNETRQLAIECQRAREDATEARRLEEMAKDFMENEKEFARKEANAMATARLEEEVRRMESQLAREKEAASEAIARQLRAECVRQLQERLTKMELQKDEELQRVLDTERKSAQSKADELHEKVVILTEEIDELRKEHLEACQQKKETTERLKKFETDLDEARYELTHKDDQIARLKSQVEDMRLEDEARVGEVAEMQKKMTNLQAAVKKAKLLLVKTETEKQTTMESHQKIESENRNLQAKLDASSLTLSAMQKRCEKLEAALHVLGPRDQELPGGSGDTVMQDTCAKLSTELNDCRKRLLDAEKENTKLHGQLRHRRSTIEKVRDQLVSIKEQGHRYVAERRYFVQIIDKLEDEVAAWKRRETDVRVALEGVTDKVIETLVARHEFIPCKVNVFGIATS